MQLRDDLVSAGAARRAVHALVGDEAIEFVRDALVLTSELVTNATLHGEGERRMEATFDEAAGSLLVVVSDGSHAEPRPQGDLPPDAVGGRGLMIVDRLATAWGSEPTATGKSVWFRLERR
jgi:two-component sensor histidine kinase